MGEKLGTGLTVDEALAEMTMVAEGVRAARMFIRRAEDESIEVPFTTAINTLLDGEIDAEECCRRIVGLN
jgi:glycerol-3-phosphate dehydrogenase (NAD(P)+)